MVSTTKSAIFLIFMSLVLVGLITLGVWQTQRLDWKLGLIEAAQTNAKAPALEIDAQNLSQLNIETQNYRNVQLMGQFDHRFETYVTAVITSTTGPQDGSGFWVLTPFLLDKHTAILVNRGFVPTRLQDPSTRTDAPTNQITITGLLRQTEPKGWITLDPDLQAQVFFSFDVTAMAANIKTRAPQFADIEFAPFFVDEATNNLKTPQSGLTDITFTNNHLGYAITWFLMALAVFSLTLYWLYRQWRERQKLGAE